MIDVPVEAPKAGVEIARSVGADDTVDRVLARLKEWRQPLAPVSDRRGKFVGVVSIEDILEEVVGEIEG